MSEQLEPVNAADPVAVKKRATKQARREARRQHDFRQVMSTPHGRRYLWWLLETACVFHTTFAENPNTAAFREGRRALGLQVLADVHALTPELYTAMVNENAGEA